MDDVGFVDLLGNGEWWQVDERDERGQPDTRDPSDSIPNHRGPPMKPLVRGVRSAGHATPAADCHPASPDTYTGGSRQTLRTIRLSREPRRDIASAPAACDTRCPARDTLSVCCHRTARAPAWRSGWPMRACHPELGATATGLPRTLPPPQRGRSSRSRRSDPANATARSMTRSSSRTFPGQSYATNASLAACDSRNGRTIRYRSRKYTASSMMSSRRCRSGGTGTSIPLSR